MVTDTQQTQFNLAIIREGLTAIASESDEQLSLINNGLKYLDSVFDHMPLDYLNWLEERNEIDSIFSAQFRDLYEQIAESIGHLEWKEEDVFIKNNGDQLKQWRQSASRLLGAINGV
ncbi:MAG: hypothetical protein KZQ73_03380 [Candidatus Thiodiazotropha sp. (ex Semelilucina semeliformis)]|nr:hypothetical protein [Candidatus Thiodiazotropha sp. (ex Semelilucina semeliformis)]